MERGEEGPDFNNAPSQSEYCSGLQEENTCYSSGRGTDVKQQAVTLFQSRNCLLASRVRQDHMRRSTDAEVHKEGERREQLLKLMFSSTQIQICWTKTDLYLTQSKRPVTPPRSRSTGVGGGVRPGTEHEQQQCCWPFPPNWRIWLQLDPVEQTEEDRYGESIANHLLKFTWEEAVRSHSLIDSIVTFSITCWFCYPAG